MNAQQEQNLRNVVRALRESKSPESFSMSAYGHGCGTPACALGHYAARPDLNGGRFSLSVDRNYDEAAVVSCGELEYPVSYTDPEIRNEFGLRRSEALLLFGVLGCGEAKTATAAADFIDAFIERKKAGASLDT
jgi:hypothetical protein